MTAAAGSTSLIRRAASIGTWNAISRVAGLVRIVVLGGALGATYLGNTYQSANVISNVLFELLAAGMLAAVLVPAIIARFVAGQREDGCDLAGAVLGRSLVVLTPVVLVGVLGAPWIMRLLVSGVSDRATRDAQARLGAFLLIFFLPQILLYAVGAVSTAVLHADKRFTAAAAAPVANSVVVIATLGLFWWRGARGLELGWQDRSLLAVGTTLGVLAMTMVTVVAARRAGLSVRPHLRAPVALAPLLRDGAWAAAMLGAAQLFVLATVSFSNSVEGGVIAYQIAFTFFLLPHALLAHPVATASYPKLASDMHAGDDVAFREETRHGMRLLAFALLPVSALLVALAPLGVTAISFGALGGGAGPDLVGACLRGYAFGLVGYSALLFLTRVSYAAGDARLPGAVNAACVVVGIALMAVVAVTSDGAARLELLGVVHSVTVLTASGIMAWVLVRRHLLAWEWRVYLTTTAWSVVGGVLAWVVAARMAEPQSARLAVIAACVVGGALGVGAYLGGQRLSGARLS